MKTDLILRTRPLGSSKAIGLRTRTRANHPIALQCLIILDVLLELAERVASRGALGSATHERHGKLN